MAATVEALLFDVDDTLCEYRRSGQELLELAFETVGTEPCFTAAEYYAIYDDHFEDAADVRENRARCFERLARKAGHDGDLGRAVAEAYAAERDHGNVCWVPGAEDALDALGRRYPIAAVTNGSPDMQAQKLEALGIADRFETIVHAGYEAPGKPSPEPFDVALDAVDVEAHHAAVVGNSLQTDVAGARAAGCRAVWLDRDGIGDGRSGRTPAPDHEPYHRIESMHELREAPWI